MTVSAFVAVVAIMVFVGARVEQLGYRAYLEGLRLTTTLDLIEVREEIERTLFAKLLLMETVRAMIERDPEITQEDFGSQVALLRREGDAIINVAAAPGLVVSMAHPLEGNEASIGLDYNTSERFGPAVRDAIASGVGTISGPVPLVQGGTGLIMRQPVYLKNEATGARELWGVIAVVLDYEAFMASVGLPETVDRYDITILSYGVDGGAPAVVYGDGSLSASGPVDLEFDFPYGTWDIQATSRGGWPAQSPSVWRVRAVMFVVGSLIIAAMSAIVILSESRRRARERLIGAIEALDDGFVLFGPDERLVVANSRYRAMYSRNGASIRAGARFEDMLRAGSKVNQHVIGPGGAEKWIDDRLRAFRSGSTTLQHVEGDRYIRVTDRRMADGSIAGLRVDVTELEIAKQEAEAANMAKTEFLGTLSHELRTPLTVILGHARIAQNLANLPQARDLRRGLEQGEPVPQLIRAYDELLASVSRMMEKLERSGSHLLTLVNEMLDFAKIESGSMAIELQEHDIAAIVGPVEEQMRMVIERKGLAFEASAAPGRVLCDEVRTRQILFNLLGNAQKFTPSGKISLEVARDETATRFSVTDSGIGIPPEQLETIFEAFHQVDTSLKKSTGGTGLGLAISRRLAEAQGGSLSVTSVQGQGSTFVLTLPNAAGGKGASDGAALAGRQALALASSD